MLKEVKFSWEEFNSGYSLNPYFNGTCSKRDYVGIRYCTKSGSLNPYFNGTCSKRKLISPVPIGIPPRLNPYFNGTCSKSKISLKFGLSITVLILILMEHAQRADRYDFKIITVGRLNPYFNGTCSKSRFGRMVWILYTLTCLNPYFNGTCSKRAFFVRPYVIICYVVKFTLINVLVLIKCTCFMQKIVQR